MVDEISTEELRRRLGDDGVQVVDIREEHETSQTDDRFVPDAVHIPMSRLTMELSEHDWSDEIYIICRHGNSSIQAARLLKAYEGVSDDATVASVAGGYLDWEWEDELVSREGEEEKKAKKAAAA
ncbi:MAG: rhodanese-like domain-containing protein [Halobacteria archaeon]|nr:rhodanese-like domain-containing protein [Halobacteria archaeon]